MVRRGPPDARRPREAAWRFFAPFQVVDVVTDPGGSRVPPFPRKEILHPLRQQTRTACGISWQNGSDDPCDSRQSAAGINFWGFSLVPVPRRTIWSRIGPGQQRCPDCNERVEAEQINIREGVAPCPALTALNWISHASKGRQAQNEERVGHDLNGRRRRLRQTGRSSGTARNSPSVDLGWNRETSPSHLKFGSNR